METKKNPIMFAQVREDPLVELAVLDKIDKQARILIVGSGGCTLFSLLGPKIGEIDVVDMNPGQIHLIQLKLELMKHFSSSYLLELFEGTKDENFVENVYQLIRDNLNVECANFWDQNLDLFKMGLTQCGVFEELFRELVQSGFDFEQVFSTDHLIELFGPDAVLNSNKCLFSEHFRQVWNRYQQDNFVEGNYFHHQIAYDSYPNIRLPIYFRNLAPIRGNINKVGFYNSSFIELLDSSDEENYDLINSSNLTDWMDPIGLDVFIKKLYTRVKKGGYVVMRRLNGDYSLELRVAKVFNIIKQGIPEDRSYFYSEVVVGQKN